MNSVKKLKRLKSKVNVIMKKFSFPLIVSMLILASGCSHFKKSHPVVSEVKDAAPKDTISLAHISDAEPKIEPLSKYGNPKTYEVFGKTYHVLAKAKHGSTQKGLASWYGTKFHGRRTSSGELYDVYGMTAAHKHLPLPTYVSVKNLQNNREIIVKVNDRGPFVDDRIIDLSYVAAKKLGIYEVGTAPVSITVIDPSHPAYIKRASKS
jgi:rare lipoprotein A